jgi:hypothetical protein
MQNTTKLKKIIQDSKELVMEADIRSRMQDLKDQLIEAINHMHKVSEVHVFVAICRGLWDRMGKVSERSVAPFFFLPYGLLINLCLGYLEFPGKSQRKQGLVQRGESLSICKFIFLLSPFYCSQDIS